MGDHGMKPYRWRQNGWPLCPECGEDELALLDLEDSTKAPQLEELPRHKLYCYRCARYTVSEGEALS